MCVGADKSTACRKTPNRRSSRKSSSSPLITHNRKRRRIFGKFLVVAHTHLRAAAVGLQSANTHTWCMTIRATLSPRLGLLASTCIDYIGTFRSFTRHVLYQVYTERTQRRGNANHGAVCIPPVAAGFGDKLGRREHRTDASRGIVHHRVALSVLTSCRHASSMSPTRPRSGPFDTLPEGTQQEAQAARRVKRETRKQNCKMSISLYGVLQFPIERGAGNGNIFKNRTEHSARC